MISPDIWQDKWFGELSHTEQIFFIGIISNCDDEGRILAEAPYLRSRIFIYQDMPLENINSMVEKFIKTNANICCYTANGSRYICLLTWSKYQKPDHASPSVIPAPPQSMNDSPNDSPKNNNDTPHNNKNEAKTDSPNDSPNDSPPSIVKYSIVKDSLVEDSVNHLKAKPLKKIYGEFKNVLLSDIEYEKLHIQFNSSLNEKIETLSCYKQSSGKKYKDDYATILNWARRDKNGNATNKERPGKVRSEASQYTDPETLRY